MTYLSAAEERDMDARFEAHQDRLADEQEQRKRLGFTEGDKVTIGRGYDPGVPLARLEPVLGFTGTSVTVDRLRAVTA